jgi:hypothetical protein
LERGEEGWFGLIVRYQSTRGWFYVRIHGGWSLGEHFVNRDTGDVGYVTRLQCGIEWCLLQATTRLIYTSLIPSFLSLIPS